MHIFVQTCILVNCFVTDTQQTVFQFKNFIQEMNANVTISVIFIGFNHALRLSEDSQQSL